MTLEDTSYQGKIHPETWDQLRSGYVWFISVGVSA